MFKIKFSELQKLNPPFFHIKKDPFLKGISFDTRMMKGGELFFALRGRHRDGHSFFDEALRKGASGVVVNAQYYQRFREKCTKFNVVGVNDVSAFLIKFACFLRKKIRSKVICITGSCGKTTTKNILSFIVSNQKKVVANPESFNNQIGVPYSISLADENTEVLILECGTSHPGEILSLSRIARPHYSVITNIGPSHQEFFGSIRKVYEEKITLAKFTKNIVIVDYDNKYLKEWIPPSRVKKISVGFKKGADYNIVMKIHRAENITFLVHPFHEEFTLRTGFIHHVKNASLSIVVSHLLGISLPFIRNRLLNFHFENRRTQLIRKKGGITVINDAYNSNPLSLEEALKSLGRFKDFKRRIVVLSDMLEQGKRSSYYHRRIGMKLHTYGVDYLFCYGKQCKFLYEGAKFSFKKRAFHFATKEELLSALKKVLYRGDLVFVKGSRDTKIDEIIEEI